jgi:hypothetical protein
MCVSRRIVAVQLQPFVWRTTGRSKRRPFAQRTRGRITNAAHIPKRAGGKPRIRKIAVCVAGSSLFASRADPPPAVHPKKSEEGCRPPRCFAFLCSEVWIRPWDRNPLTTHHSPLTTHHSPLTTYHSLPHQFFVMAKEIARPSGLPPTTAALPPLAETR